MVKPDFLHDGLCGGELCGGLYGAVWLVGIGCLPFLRVQDRSFQRLHLGLFLHESEMHENDNEEERVIQDLHESIELFRITLHHFQIQMPMPMNIGHSSHCSYFHCNI